MQVQLTESQTEMAQEIVKFALRTNMPHNTKQDWDLIMKAWLLEGKKFYEKLRDEHSIERMILIGINNHKII